MYSILDQVHPVEGEDEPVVFTEHGGVSCVLAYELNLSCIDASRLIEICGMELTREEIKDMLETIIVILLVLWLLGLVAGQTFGGILNVLLLVAVVVFVIRLLTGRAAV